jgi:hypothetical protein
MDVIVPPRTADSVLLNEFYSFKEVSGESMLLKREAMAE